MLFPLDSSLIQNQTKNCKGYEPQAVVHCKNEIFHYFSKPKGGNHTLNQHSLLYFFIQFSKIHSENKFYHLESKLHVQFSLLITSQCLHWNPHQPKYRDIETKYKGIIVR